MGEVRRGCGQSGSNLRGNNSKRVINGWVDNTCSIASKACRVRQEMNMPSPIPAQKAPMIPRIPQSTDLVLLVVVGPSRVSVGSPKIW